MPIILNEVDDGRILEVKAGGKLVHEDFELFARRFDQLRKRHGQIRVLCDIVRFDGWEASAVWDEIKWDVKHFSDIACIAVVGAKTWEEQLSLFWSPFITGEIRYFDQTKAAEARTWLEGSLHGQRTDAAERILF